VALSRGAMRVLDRAAPGKLLASGGDLNVRQV
jgi:hypothetical protein